MKALSIQLAVAVSVMLLAGDTLAQAPRPANPAAPATISTRTGTLHNILPPSSMSRFNLPNPFYPYPRYIYRASTVFESYARGQAAVIRAQGQYNLMTSQSRVYNEEAERRAIENREERIKNYYAMRETNRAARAAERGPRLTSEALHRFAAAGKPKRLSPGDLEAASGRVSWPVLLQTDEFSGFRADLDKLFAERAADGQMCQAERIQAKQATDGMLAQLKKRVREVPSTDYIATRRFIESLACEARLPAS